MADDTKPTSETQGAASVKAGARHNKGDQARINKWHKAADELKQDMADLGAAIEDAGEQAAAKGADITADDAPVIFGAVKAAGDWELDVLYLPYGGPNAGKDSHGEYFTARTNEHADKFPNPLILYYHGHDADGKPQGEPVIIGKALKRWADTAGRWVRVQLDRASDYARRMWEAAQKGVARASSGSIAHLVRSEKDGHITNWPVVEISLIDAAGKRQPANQYAVALPAAKSHLQLAGQSLPAEFDTPAPDSQSQATGSQSAADAGKGATVVAGATSQPAHSAKGIIDMTEQELQALLDKRDAERDAAAKAEAERKAKEQERVDAAVKAAVEAERKESAKSRRLADGAPHVAQFADTRKYDGMSAADLAFAGAMLGADRRGKRLSESAAKALLIKVSEEKTDAGEESRNAAKALGFNPEDAKDAAKANELNYSTQAGFGDEFVPTVWSSTLWNKVRYNAGIVSRIPQRSFTGPGDTFPLPVEGADPTFYRIGQATDNNATTGRPDATVGDSKVATTNKNITFSKMGARIGYTGEMDEDSIVQWAGQVRLQTEAAFVEQLEHVVVDGDTATGATTNINHIGGTPTSTGTKQDLFLLVDGFRKLPLVTNTANSVNATGSLADTTFLTVLQLLGDAGLNADPEKVDFIIDANVFWKVQQLVSVKTRDVFMNATLENGMFSGIWGFKVWRSAFMHYRSTTNPRKANTAGKVDLTTQANNTTGSILAVRRDQWLLGYKRNITMKLQDIPDSDAQQLIATARVGLVFRDNEASAIAYNVGV